MNYKKYLITLLKSFGIGLGIMLVSTMLLTILNYFNLFTGSFFSILKFLIPLISLFIAGTLFGKQSKQKGWLEGLKLSMIFLLCFTILQWLVIKEPFQFGNLVYDLILMIVTIFGSMIGINLKANEK